MSTKVADSYHVVARSNGNWSVHRVGAARVTKTYATKRDAIAEGKRLSRSSGSGSLIIHGKDGRVVSRLALDPPAPPPNGNGNSK